MPKEQFEALSLFDEGAFSAEVQQTAEELQKAVEQEAVLEDRHRAMLRLLLEVDTSRDVVIALLEVFFNLPPALSRYMGGPIIVSGGAWAEITPERAIKAAILDRFDRVCDELISGEIGHYATPSEVIAAMYGQTMAAPMRYEWAQVYFWCGCQTAVKHGWVESEEAWWEMLGTPKYPIRLEQVWQDYNEIASDIRRKVVQIGQSRGYGKRVSKREMQESEVKPEPSTPQYEALSFDFNNVAS